MTGLRCGCGFGWGGRFGGLGEAVVVGVVYGRDDCFAPVVFAAGGNEFVLGKVQSLEHGLGQVSEGAGGAGLQFAAGYGYEDTA
jgi:hypothetical protein